MKEEFPRDQDGEIIPFEEWSRDVDREFGPGLQNYFDLFIIGLFLTFCATVAFC